MNTAWIQWLEGQTGKKYQLQRAVTVGGGCINEAFKIIGKHQHLFAKRNNIPQAAAMFSTESKGLALLRENGKNLIVPEVVYVGKDPEGYDILVMDWMDQGHPNHSFWESFGQALAQLHSVSSSIFGLDHNNFIGKLDQINEPSSDWPSFYFKNRLIHQLEMGVTARYFESTIFKKAENVYRLIEQSFPKEAPALLHGDLWSGNFVCTLLGNAGIFDPAVYYGNRETEIVFTQLFGGFDDAFYASYNDIFPIQHNFKERKDIHQLYPLLVHANLFGGGYISRCNAILEYYGR